MPLEITDWITADWITAIAAVIAIIAASYIQKRQTDISYRQMELAKRQLEIIEYQERASYLRMSLKVDALENGFITAQTTVENRGILPKKLSDAFLLIGPESKGPIDTANAIMEAQGLDIRFEVTNEFEHHFKEPLSCADHASIPLKFYYLENVKISDETLTYRATINTEDLQEGVPYSVRFFIFGDHNRLHRSVQDCFIIYKKSLRG